MSFSIALPGLPVRRDGRGRDADGGRVVDRSRDREVDALELPVALRGRLLELWTGEVLGALQGTDERGDVLDRPGAALDGRGAALLVQLLEPDPLRDHRRELVEHLDRPLATSLELLQDRELVFDRGLLRLDVLHLADDLLELGDLRARPLQLLRAGGELGSAAAAPPEIADEHEDDGQREEEELLLSSHLLLRDPDRKQVDADHGYLSPARRRARPTATAALAPTFVSSVVSNFLLSISIALNGFSPSTGTAARSSITLNRSG